MPTFEEMTLWGPDEIHAQILLLLPKDWRFELLEERLELQLRALFLDAEGVEVWCNTGPDDRLLLFDAYGWLLTRDRKTVNQNWPVREPRKHVPVGRVNPHGEPIPDPEDLNPVEIIAVYSGQHKNVRR